MKRLGVALMILAAMLRAGAPANAQLPTPMPPPVPSFPIDVPPPPTMLPRDEAPPQVIEGLVVSGPTIPDIRVPTQFRSRYAAPHTEPPYIGVDSANRATGETGCNACGPLSCGPAGRFWVEWDILVWQPTGDRMRPLLTTGPAGTPIASAGVLGAPGTAALIGNSSLSDDFRAGSRLNVGGWFNTAQTIGVQVGSIGLGERTTTLAFSSPGNTILARPFTDATTGAAASQLVAYPTAVAGSMVVSERNRFGAFDAALRGNMCCTANWRLDALLGYRYIRLEDNLIVDESLIAGPAAPVILAIPAGASFRVADLVNATNTFNGVQVGVAGEYRFNDRWSVSGSGKASFGWVNQVVDIAGLTTTTVPGGPTISNGGGFLALATNTGRHAESTATVIPEVNLNIGYQVTRHVRLRVGYSFLYVPSVVRPGTAIDTTINPGLLPPAVGPAIPARPAYSGDHTDYFLHGASGGVEIRF